MSHSLNDIFIYRYMYINTYKFRKSLKNIDLNELSNNE